MTERPPFPAIDASVLDLGAFRTALLAVLGRIATALEEANAADPVQAALAVIEETERAARRPVTSLPADEEWRLR